MDHLGWIRLKEGTDAEVVLAVDFPGRQQTAGMRELAPLLQVPYSVWQPSPPDGPAAAGVSAYLAPWLRTIADNGLTVRAVLGSCGGAPIACAVAAACEREGVRPATVLFDPEVICPESLHYQFMLAVGQIARRSGAVTTQLDEWARETCATDDVLTAARAVADKFYAYGVPALAELGVDAHSSDGICGRFARYCEYLAVASLAGYAESGVAVTAASREWSRPPDLGGTIHRFEASHDDLLNARSAAALASCVIRTGGPDGTSAPAE